MKRTTLKRRLKAAWWGFRHFRDLHWMAGTCYEVFDDNARFAQKLDDDPERREQRHQANEMEDLQTWLVK